MKAYFCNKPKPNFECSKENNFVLDQVRKINRNNSNCSRNNSKLEENKSHPFERKLRGDQAKNIPNDERFYVPKGPSQIQPIIQNKGMKCL